MLIDDDDVQGKASALPASLVQEAADEPAADAEILVVGVDRDPRPAAASRRRSDRRVGHDFPDLLRTAARGSELGSPLQCVLT